MFICPPQPSFKQNKSLVWLKQVIWSKCQTVGFCLAVRCSESICLSVSICLRVFICLRLSLCAARYGWPWPPTAHPEQRPHAPKLNKLRGKEVVNINKGPIRRLNVKRWPR